MTNQEQYSYYREKKEELSRLLHESSEVIEELSMPVFSSKLKMLGDKVANDSFKIQIVGTFKNGKSTFINVLLGENVLPTRALPCTAVVNEIKYGDNKRAVLHFRSPLPKELINSIPKATLQHMEKHNMKDIPPMDIEYDNMSSYVTIPIDGDPDEISVANPFKTVELFYPLQLLKEGVEIIDSPGLNEADERTICTLEYLDKADAIIYLLDANRACAKDEMDTIESILIPKGFKDMFFVANKIDVVPKNERDDVKRYIESKVADFTTNEIFCVSALQALNGKLNSNSDLYMASGMSSFEDRLTEFLTKEKGQVKLAQPARELNNILSKEALYKAIPNQRKQLSTSLDTFKDRYDSVKPQLDELQRQKEQMKLQMELQLERNLTDIKRAVLREYREVANLVNVWVEEYSPKTSIGLAGKKTIQKICDEIVNYVSDKAKEKFSEWNTSILIPLIEEKSQLILESTDKNLKGIFDVIDDINAQISGENVEINSASGWERLAGAAGLYAGLPNTGASVLMNGFNFKDNLKSFAMDIGLYVGIGLLGIANPVLLIPIVVAVVWHAFKKGDNLVVKKIKNELTPAIRDSILNDSEQKVSEMIGKIKDEFDKLINDSVSVIDLQIEDIKAQVETILQDMRQGKEQIDKRNQILDNCEQRLQNICGKLDSFVFELAGLSE